MTTTPEPTTPDPTTPEDNDTDLLDGEVEDDWEDECECEGSGCMECQPDRHTFDAIKWTADGELTLEATARALESHAQGLREMAAQGWVLDQPVDNGHLSLTLPPDKPVPEQSFIQTAR